MTHEMTPAMTAKEWAEPSYTMADTRLQVKRFDGDLGFRVFDKLGTFREKDRHALALESRNRTADHILQDVADLQGDVDAYMARYSAEQLTYHTIAPSVAERLLAAGRADEALAQATQRLAALHRASATAAAWMAGTPPLMSCSHRSLTTSRPKALMDSMSSP